MKFRHLILGASLLFVAISSSALSLGRARGNTVLGQALDISFEVRLDQPDDSSAPCVAADILHGETRVDPSRTRISVEPIGQGQEVLIRVRSSVVVEEPVVSMVLRVGCNQNTTRRYDFLTDFPTEANTAAAIAAAAPAMAPVPAPAPVAPPPPAASPLPPMPPAAVRPPAPQAVPRVLAPPVVRAPRPAAAPRPARPPQPAPAVAARAAEVPAARSRLRLETPEVLPERERALKSSSALLAAPAPDNSPQRAEAAALWRALNTTPADQMAESKRLQDVESANKALRELAARNEAKLAELQTRLQKMEEERYANGLVYALLALLVALAALAAYLWSRRNQVAEPPEWWKNRVDAAAAPADDQSAAGVLTEANGARPSAPMPALTNVDVDLDVGDSNLGKGAALVAGAAAAGVVRRTAAGGNGSVQRAVNPEDLFDVQQHADFFVSLGQYDQAIEVLRKHILARPESSPLAYLDLLKIFHTLSRTEDYNQVRGEFNRHFNGHVPPFLAFSNEGQALESYPDALGDIVALWPTQQAGDLIEEMLYPDPARTNEQPFDMAAFRELLLLHAMLRSGLSRDTDSPAAREAARRVNESRRVRLSQFGDSDISPLDKPDAVREGQADSSKSGVSQFGDSELSSVAAVLSPHAIELYTPSGVPVADLPAAQRQPDPGSLDLDLSAIEDLPPAGDSITAELQPDDFPKVMSPAADVAPSVTASVPDPAEAHKDNLIDFDLFDPKLEADISPKTSRH